MVTGRVLPVNPAVGHSPDSERSCVPGQLQLISGRLSQSDTGATAVFGNALDTGRLQANTDRADGRFAQRLAAQPAHVPFLTDPKMIALVVKQATAWARVRQ
jgi:hypothetical protein